MEGEREELRYFFTHVFSPNFKSYCIVFRSRKDEALVVTIPIHVETTPTNCRSTCRTPSPTILNNTPPTPGSGLVNPSPTKFSSSPPNPTTRLPSSPSSSTRFPPDVNKTSSTVKNTTADSSTVTNKKESITKSTTNNNKNGHNSGNSNQNLKMSPYTGCDFDDETVELLLIDILLNYLYFNSVLYIYMKAIFFINIYKGHTKD